MSWIKKSKSQLERELKITEDLEKEIDKEREDEKKRAYIPEHTYQTLHDIKLTANKSVPSWNSVSSKDDKDELKKSEDEKHVDKTKTSINVKPGWKEVNYNDSLKDIAKVIRSVHNNNIDNHKWLADLINK